MIRERLRLFVISTGERIIRIVERLIARYSLVPNDAFLNPELFPWSRNIERNWEKIRRELDAILGDRDSLPNFQDISVDQKAITDDDRWKSFLLYAYGIKAERNCARCPDTTNLIEEIPGFKTAFFSILAPGKHIPEHRGPYKGVIRYHLGLLIPEPVEQCRIRVGDEVRHWEEGKSLIFDDSYRHEVWNDTDGERVVLFLDFVRPTAFPVSLLNRVLIKAIALSPFIQDVFANQKKWDRKIAEAEQTSSGIN